MLGAGISPTGGMRDPVLAMGATGLVCAQPAKPARPTIPTRNWRYIGTSPSLETRRRVAAALLDNLADGRSSRIDDRSVRARSGARAFGPRGDLGRGRAGDGIRPRKIPATAIPGKFAAPRRTARPESGPTTPALQSE